MSENRETFWILMKTEKSAHQQILQNYALVFSKALHQYDQNVAEFEQNGLVKGIVLCIGYYIKI